MSLLDSFVRCLSSLPKGTRPSLWPTGAKCQEKDTSFGRHTTYNALNGMSMERKRRLKWKTHKMCTCNGDESLDVVLERGELVSMHEKKAD